MSARRSIFAALLALALPSTVIANRNGLPLGRLGAFAEQQTCSGAGCHRSGPIVTGRVASVRVDVGPYVPNATQPVRVIIEGPGASSWGFQLSPRLASDPSRLAGELSPGATQFVSIHCADGSMAPQPNCGVQYATHSFVGSIPGNQLEAKSFVFDWTAPSDDVGAVIFAVAALAADGDGTILNDVGAVTQQVSIFAPSNQPVLSANGILSAAALQRPTQTVSPKQLITLFGVDLNAPGAFVPVSQIDFDFQGRVPDELARLSVIFTTPGRLTEHVARILFVSDTQVNLQAPDFPVDAELVRIQAVINRGRGSNEIRSNIVEVAARSIAPGLFALDSSGVGPAAAVNGITGQVIAAPGFTISGQPIPGAVQAQAGDIVLLFGTGFGPFEADVPLGQRAPVSPLTNAVTIEIGGRQATIDYAGAAPSFVGLTQFNVRVPDGLPPGEHDVFVRSGSLISQPGITLSTR